MTNRSKVLVVVVAMTIVGVMIALRATSSGVGVFPDSTVYFDAAQNLGSGRGFVVISGASPELKPLNHYPPLYSSLLALGLAGGATVEVAARWLNAIIFGVNILLVGLSISFCARNSFWAPAIGSLLTLAAPDLISMHSVAMTEPLYLALTLGGLLSLASYMQNSRRRFLCLAAILIALSFLTRYVGIAGVVTGIVALLFSEPDEGGRRRITFSLTSASVRRRVVDILLFAVISFGPMALWSLRNFLATGGGSDRQLAFHPVKFQQLVAAFSTVAQWLLLGKVRADLRFLGFVVEVLLLVSVAIYVTLSIRRRKVDNEAAEGRTSLPLLLVVFVIAYASLFLLTITFFETDNVLDSRSLLPIHFALLVLIPYLGRSVYLKAGGTRSLRIVFVTLALLLAGSYIFRSGRWLVRAQGDGQGYSSRAWKESQTVAEVKMLPQGIPIYSNGIDAIYYLTGRRALEIPARIVRGTGQPNPRYQDELQKMREDLRMRDGVVVYFNTLTERVYLPLESELQTELLLTEGVRLSDGAITRLKVLDQTGPAH